MGSRNKKASPVLIDFDTGDSVVDEISERRKIQDRMYQLDNPYVGNKRGILLDIVDALDKNDVKYEQVLDLFSGSGVVSTFFKLLGNTVVSNDLLTSSYYNALAFSVNNSIFLTNAERTWLCTNNNPNKNRFVTENYAERFTPEECAFLDNYRANIDTFIEERFREPLHQSRTSPHGPNSGTLDLGIKVTKAVCILTIEHYVLNRCFLGGRLNKGQVLADLDHRLAHDRNKGDSMRFTLDPLPTFFHDEDMGCMAYNMDALEAAKNVRISHPGIQLAYIDPPYGQSQSDYATMFAFCEEYVYGKKLDELSHIQTASKKFAQKKNYKDHFREALDQVNWIPIWAVSFNAASFDDADGIASILREFKKDVVTVSIDHEYRYRKERGAAVEYLFIAR